LSCTNRGYNSVSKEYTGGCGSWQKASSILSGDSIPCTGCSQYKKQLAECKNCIKLAWDAKPEVIEYKALNVKCACDRDAAVWLTKNKEPSFYYFKCPITKKEGDGWVSGCKFWARCEGYDAEKR
jgi:hypothetical protein